MKNEFKRFCKNSYDTFFLVCVVIICCGSLYFVNRLTSQKRSENETKEQSMALAKLYDDPSLTFVKVKQNRFVSEYAPTSDGNGYILSLVGSGYGGTISLLAHYLKSGEILAVICVSHSETDGIGSVISLPHYMDIFKGYGGDKKIPTTKREVNSQYIDVVSGATVSFNGVSAALFAGEQFVKALNGATEVENG